MCIPWLIEKRTHVPKDTHPSQVLGFHGLLFFSIRAGNWAGMIIHTEKGTLFRMFVYNMVQPDQTLHCGQQCGQLHVGLFQVSCLGASSCPARPHCSSPVPPPDWSLTSSASAQKPAGESSDLVLTGHQMHEGIPIFQLLRREIHSAHHCFCRPSLGNRTIRTTHKSSKTSTRPS